jgi:hypothetical protein
MTAISIAVVGWAEFLDYPKYVWKLEQAWVAVPLS